MDTLAAHLSRRTLDAIVGHFGLREVTGQAGGPFLPLAAKPFGGAPVGSLRLWDGGGKLSKVVYTGITVEPIGLDSHMIFAFTDKASPVPTFTLDSVYTRLPAVADPLPPGADPNFPNGGDMYAFHLDLVPRCDLGINAAYMRRCYVELTEPRAAVLAAEGVYPALLSPMQRAIMSPWMLAQRTTPEAYGKAVFPAAETYVNHWMAMVDDGLKGLAAHMLGKTGPTRDARNRELIFSRDIDPVWRKIDGLLGADVSDRMIGMLRNQAVESPGDGA